MIKFIFLIIAALFGLINYYVAHKLTLAVSTLFTVNATLLIGISITALAATTLATFFLPSMSVGSFIGKLGNYWLGLSLLAFVVFAISDGVNKIAKLQPSLWGVAIPLIIITVLYSYGTWHATQIQLAKYDITIPKSFTSEQVNAVMLSDVHLGYINDNAKLKKIITKTNALQPDIIFIAGDLFVGNFEAVKNPEETLRLLNSFEAKNGVYLAWGNHDAGENFTKMKKLIARSSIILLEDTIVEAPNGLLIAGRRDSRPIGNQEHARTAITNAIAQQNTTKPLIVIDHQPSNIDEYTGAVDLIVSGHTHKGQIFPFGYITRAMFTVDYGYYQAPTGTQVIVSSGAGFWGPPMRIGTDSEIVQITMNFTP